MRKIALLLAIVSVAVLAAPALSATNPFMDVPMNHWAYDAIGQLAAHGILSGYPDGTYKGKQATTRYEMASALARALAVVDMTKASKQDVEMLKRLVVEFKDELEALGVKVSELDERVAILEDRLGGWKISGTLALQATYRNNNDIRNVYDTDGTLLGGINDGKKTTFDYDEAKLIFDRWFGEDEQYHFQARFRGDSVTNTNNATLDRFFVEMPFFYDTKLTIGRFSWAWEGAYKVSMPETGGFTGDQPMTDWRWDGFGLTKNFGIGSVNAVVAHPNHFNGRRSEMGISDMAYALVRSDGYSYTSTSGWDVWMFMLGANLQFTEKVGFDLGFQAFVGDNAEEVSSFVEDGAGRLGDRNFKNMWTLWAGLRLNFMEGVGFKGVFYHQKWDTEMASEARDENDNLLGYYWADTGDDANHWAVMFDVSQEALKYSSLWLEYGQYDRGFHTRGDSTIFYAPTIGLKDAPEDMKYWRIALGQQWNEKFATHIFYYGYKIDNLGYDGGDWKPKEMGIGFQYKLNDYTTMGLNYVHVDMDDFFGPTTDNDDVVRFRTLVTF